ncbi:response regulator transcription factor [Advenella sp. FME57]|uniref:response regulator transcription factor n=1 Tax=Advenella sp. FME57 TaxID=2742604 RepID=UPI001868947C|nr:response regulator transcription factor [Advenella sp. FME57]
MLRCLIIEDDHEIAHYIANTLREQNHLAFICDNGLDGLLTAQQKTWDIILLDLTLPNGINGLSILTSLRQAGDKTPVIVQSSLALINHRVEGLKAGADDYLAKPFSMTELIARIDAIVRRVHCDSTQFDLSVGDIKINLQTMQVEKSGKKINLPSFEFKLLSYLIINAENVVTIGMLSQAIWPYSFSPPPNLIDQHVNHLRDRLEDHSANPLIRKSGDQGYLLTTRQD